MSNFRKSFEDYKKVNFVFMLLCIMPLSIMTFLTSPWGYLFVIINLILVIAVIEPIIRNMYLNQKKD
jgi:hypothetical protein